MSAEPDGFGSAIAGFDQRGAFLTFDALEKVVIQAVAAEEYEVAAEYVDWLFALGAQLDELHEEYCAESDRLADRDAKISREVRSLEAALYRVNRWAVVDDHPVAEWFEEGDLA